MEGEECSVAGGGAGIGHKQRRLPLYNRRCEGSIFLFLVAMLFRLSMRA